MFGIGFQEMLIILVVVLIFFGPKRLPDLAKSIGKGIAEFKKASEEVRQGINEAMREDATEAGPSKDAAGQAGPPAVQEAAAADAPPAETPVPPPDALLAETPVPPPDAARAETPVPPADAGAAPGNPSASRGNA